MGYLPQELEKGLKRVHCLLGFPLGMVRMDDVVSEIWETTHTWQRLFLSTVNRNFVALAQIDNTKLPRGRPPNHVVGRYTSFHHHAKSWSKPRRILAKIEFHPGDLFPKIGFIVTNRNLPNERVLAFYNYRGTAEQHIK